MQPDGGHPGTILAVVWGVGLPLPDAHGHMLSKANVVTTTGIWQLYTVQSMMTSNHISVHVQESVLVSLPFVEVFT